MKIEIPEYYILYFLIMGLIAKLLEPVQHLHLQGLTMTYISINAPIGSVNILHRKKTKRIYVYLFSIHLLIKE